MSLRITLTGDGSSDRALLYVIKWLLQDKGVTCAIQDNFMHRDAIGKPKADQNYSALGWRILRSVQDFPCDVLFVHRDSELRDGYETRRTEIEMAQKEIGWLHPELPVISVIPVRMMESWLLFDVEAIRYAAGNKNGKSEIVLPPSRRIEEEPDPKTLLRELLFKASGLSQRRFGNISPERVAFFIEDFKPLYDLPAFKRLEADIVKLLQSVGDMWSDVDQ